MRAFKTLTGSFATECQVTGNNVPDDPMQQHLILVQGLELIISFPIEYKIDHDYDPIPFQQHI